MNELIANDKGSRKTVTQKISSFLSYHKHFFFSLFLLILLLFYIGDVAYRSTKEFVLQGFIANDEENLFNTQQLSKEMQIYLELNENQIAVFDDSLFVVFDKADHYIESSISKIYAYMAAKELDFLIAPKEIVEHYSSALPFFEFKDLLPGDLYDQVSPHLKESMSFDGKKGNYLLSLSSSRFAETTDLYMIVPKEAPHQQTLIQFIKYAFLVEEE